MCERAGCGWGSGMSHPSKVGKALSVIVGHHGTVAFTVRKPREVSLVLSSLLSFLSGLGPQPVGWYLPRSRQTFPPRLKLPGNAFADKPRGVSPVTPNPAELTTEINCHTSQPLASSGWSQSLTSYVSQLPTLRGHRDAEGLAGALTMKTATAVYFLSSV